MFLSFTSLEFFVFFTFCLILVHSTTSVSTQRLLLVVFSYIFIVSLSVVGVLLVTAVALVDFNVARRIVTSDRIDTRKRLLWISLTANLGALIFFKYSVFLADIIGTRLPLAGHLPLPIGLSFFTFAGMSYVLDSYYERIAPMQSILEYICYLLYFPKLVAGPIVRAGELLPQLRRGIQLTSQDAEIGCGYLLAGAVKKLVIADRLAPHVSMILAAPQHYDASTLVQGMVGYTVQIYADFSGYSDMAIGCARLMGIRLPQNFLMPYSAVNIAEFWRRWHVTLSFWFRDYVFLPLELGSRGTRNACLRTARSILITMLLCGLWHGASWTFVLWGGLHGVALVLYRTYAGIRSRWARSGAPSGGNAGTLLARALTVSFVMVGWICFGSPTVALAFKYLWRIVTWRSDGVSLWSPYIVPLAALMFIAHVLIDKNRNLIEGLPVYPMQVRVLTYAGVLLVLTCLAPSDAVPFAYIRF